MANNNDQLFNAAIAAFLGGAQNSSITDPVQADYAPVVNAAVAFATQVDAGIPTDGTIVTPVTAATLKKVNLLQSICQGVMAGRYPTNNTTSTTAATYATQAAAIAACYKQAALSLA